MARSVLSTLAAGILLTFCLQGESLPPPTQVRFKTNDFYHHILTWEPGRNSTGKAWYQVEYMRYGSNWELTKHCAKTVSLSCNLTTETMDPNHNYFGRVRAVLEDQVSEWSRTSRFSPQEVILPAPHLALNVERNTVYIKVKSPSLRRQNITVEFNDIFKYNIIYKLYVRRASDNFTFVQVVDLLQSELSNLAWGQQYCIAVCAEVKSRPNPGIRSKEHCVSVPEEERTSSNVIIILACVCILTIIISFGKIFICWYINRPASTPESLKSFATHSSHWIEDQQLHVWDYSILQCLDDLTLKKMFMELKSRCGSMDSGFCSEKQTLENTCSCFTLTHDDPEQTLEPGAPQASEHSCSSADSGIYPGGTPFGWSPPMSENKAYQKQIKATESDDSGISMERDSPCSTRLADRREQPTITYEDDLQGKREPGLVNSTGECNETNGSQGHINHQGYKKQSKYWNGSFQSQNGSSNDKLFSIDVTDSAQKTCIEGKLDCSVLDQAKGYLKQTSQKLGLVHSDVTSDHADGTFLKDTGMMVFSASLELRSWGLHHENLVTSTDLKYHTNCKVTSDVTDLLMPFPLISSLNSNDIFTLETNTLSLADMELEDGHV
ncbi:interleukin-10 receptor subunit alpha [Microcaecilia unicolor]|uniref:Interleukin-10 receptor subunit alpha n=1 Tax=Microcaecilia unicolor TaxID=1415580 RepID=A0A6P7ZAE3_9AMPH|nr:interleukin-10 receptor subunit alpha [Microcaecilia unicolor]